MAVWHGNSGSNYMRINIVWYFTIIGSLRKTKKEVQKQKKERKKEYCRETVEKNNECSNSQEKLVR